MAMSVPRPVKVLVLSAFAMAASAALDSAQPEVTPSKSLAVTRGAMSEKLANAVGADVGTPFESASHCGATVIAWRHAAQASDERAYKTTVRTNADKSIRYEVEFAGDKKQSAELRTDGSVVVSDPIEFENDGSGKITNFDMIVTASDLKQMASNLMAEIGKPMTATPTACTADNAQVLQASVLQQ